MTKSDSFPLNTIPHKNNAILAYRTIDGEAVIVDLQHETLNRLNTTATKIWEFIDDTRSVQEVVEKIAGEYDISVHKVAEDVVEILDNMASVGWISNFPCCEQTATKHNKKENLFEELREHVTRNRIPLVIHFDLTYRCPLNCVHCYIVNDGEHKECSLYEVKHILDQLAQEGTLYLTFSGGEIFLRDDLPEIISHARKLHFAVRLLTSGTLIDAKLAEQIADWHPEMVALSIYDLDETIHDSITRRKGSLAKTLETIETLKERGVPLKISSVLMNRNVEHFRSIHDFAKELGAGFQADYRITPKTDGSMEPLRYHIGDENVRQIISDPIFSREHEQEPEEKYCGVFNAIPCGAGHMSCYISPYGIVTPCIQIPLECGSLRAKSFSTVWHHSHQLDKFRNLTFADMPRCTNCKSFAYCRPCPGLNLVETGNIATPPQRICREAEHMRTLNRRRR